MRERPRFTAAIPAGCHLAAQPDHADRFLGLENINWSIAASTAAAAEAFLPPGAHAVVVKDHSLALVIGNLRAGRPKQVHEERLVGFRRLVSLQ